MSEGGKLILAKAVIVGEWPNGDPLWAYENRELSREGNGWREIKAPVANNVNKEKTRGQVS